MTKMVVFMMLFLPSMFAFMPAADLATCSCATVSNVQKTGQTSNSISYAWDGSQGATQYKVWFTRQEDQYTSSYFYTLTPSFTFTNLSAGHYTFNIVAECGGEASNIVGLEDFVQL